MISRCHTRGSIVGAGKRPYFLTFSFIFARFGHFACFGRFARFVSAISFRCLGFYVTQSFVRLFNIPERITNE